MRNFYFLLIGLCSVGFADAQTISFTDPNLKQALLSASVTSALAQDSNGNNVVIDTSGDGEIQVSEASLIYKLSLGLILNNISHLGGLEEFINLTELHCPESNLQIVDLTVLTSLRIADISGNNITSLQVTGMSNLEVLNCNYNELTTIDLSGLTNLQTLSCTGNNLSTLDITDLDNLVSLSCGNNSLSYLDLSGCAALTVLIITSNQFLTIDFSGAPNLQTFNCDNNLLTTLDVTGLQNLSSLSCNFNLLTSLNVSGMQSLGGLDCNSNQLTSLDLTGLENLQYIDCSENLLTEIIFFPEMDILDSIYCVSNPITTIDLRQLPSVSALFLNNCTQLTSILGKNGALSELMIDGCTQLQYVCVNENILAYVQDIIAINGWACEVNSYCSFTPGGTFYTIEGQSRIDSDSNGCNGSDMTVPALKFNISDGTNTGVVITNTSGAFAIPVVVGTHTITPILENPLYFNITPSSVTANFPSDASPFIQDFCITPNGFHPDLEISILPLDAARPGFNAMYKIIYKNNGNVVTSGSINLAFDDAIEDFIISNPIVSSQSSNSLVWDFTNLAPFEMRTITMTFNVNSPMESPPANAGDLLIHSATINIAATDEMPDDNYASVEQVLTNSFDPNDKTCLEGATIIPSEVGKFVHYMIRFENTGNANAENIVVKDLIDPAKFDIATLVPSIGSHPFVTNISMGNKVEFIFENINLPFDDANNDGYVAFKIKTKTTLVLGDTFSNTASIYFDYNFPIVTDPAVTTVAILGNKDFEFSNYFAVYPNPANILLNIQSKQNIEISSISIYNMLGQVVLVIPNAKGISTVDVSTLKSGNYFIKVDSDMGSSNTKFIKN